MDDLKEGQVELKVHGLQHVHHSEVPASVFANRLRALVSALEAADVAANGKGLHLYTIARLHTSEPTAILNERPKSNLYVDSSASAVPAFEQGIEAIKAGSKSSREMVDFASAVMRLTSGAEKNFGFAEVRTRQSDVINVIRIDDFLRERARVAARVTEYESVPAGGWYKGAVFGSFDGQLELVDIRGALPRIKLTLSAGERQIDCICRREDIEALGSSLGHRVRVAGRAIYDGRSGLPRRVEVTEIKPISEPGDFARWQGAFEPFTVPDWDGGNA